MTRNEFTDRASDGGGFEEELRGLLHAAADPVQPDPAGWRQLNARITRRRRVVRAGGLALAGAAVAMVAVAVLPDLGQQQVELVPGGIATQPALVVDPSGTMAPAESPDGATPSLARGILYSDGESIHVADLDGQILFTPAQGGDGTSVITDVVVRPGGTTEDFTMAYAFDSTTGGRPCGDISWTRVVGPDNNVAGGGIPDLDRISSEICISAPVFTSDGSALGWFATRTDGTTQLQAIEWTPEGPVDGTMRSVDVDLGGIVDPSPVQWEVGDPDGDTAGSGAFSFRGVQGQDAGLFTIPTQTTDQGLFVPPIPPDAEIIVPTHIDVGRLLDVDEDWLIARPSDPPGMATPGVLVVGRDTADAAGQGGPVSTSEVVWSPGGALFIDALGDTAVFGGGNAMVLVTIDAEGTTVVTDLPSATTAALLGGTAVSSTPSTGQSNDAQSVSTATPAATATVIPSPTSDASSASSPAPATPSPGVEPTQAAPQPPPAVLSTAASLRQAASARDWDVLAALLPASGFTSNYGAESDHIAYYQWLADDGVDVFGILTGLLSVDPARMEGDEVTRWVWPPEFADEPGFFDWRTGIDEDGTWRFLVAGD